MDLIPVAITGKNKANVVDHEELKFLGELAEGNCAGIRQSRDVWKCAGH